MTEPKKIITGKACSKRYRCTSCGHESEQSTNHYGQIYPRCTNCGWKHPMEFGQVHECMEKPPKGWGKPEPWKMMKIKQAIKENPERILDRVGLGVKELKPRRRP